MPGRADPSSRLEPLRACRWPLPDFPGRLARSRDIMAAPSSRPLSSTMRAVTSRPPGRCRLRAASVRGPRISGLTAMRRRRGGTRDSPRGGGDARGLAGGMGSRECRRAAGRSHRCRALPRRAPTPRIISARTDAASQVRARQRPISNPRPPTPHIKSARANAPYQIRARQRATSASTISAIMSSSVVCGIHPSRARAREASPTVTSTSAGRRKAGSTRTCAA